MGLTIVGNNAMIYVINPNISKNQNTMFPSISFVPDRYSTLFFMEFIKKSRETICKKGINFICSV